MTKRHHKSFTKSVSVLLVAMVCALVGLAVPALAAAATYTVNSTGDQVDATPGDEICLTAANTCTLRAAIEESNEVAGEDSIDFNSTFNGQVGGTINLGSALPPVEDELLTIDGQCMVALVIRPCVGVNGPAGGTTLQVEGELFTVEGLALTGATVGLNATAEAKESTVRDNWIGSKLDGSASADAAGIEIVGLAVVEGNEISGGTIGIHTAGSQALSGGNEIKANAVSGTLGSGILLENESNQVSGNKVSAAGAAGIRIHGNGADENVIGSASFEAVSADENLIDGSAGPAIEINTGTVATSNRVLRNHGSGNTGKFIAIVPIIGGAMPNNGIEPPEITEATSTEASGTAEPETYVRVYSKVAAEPGELGAFLGLVEAESSGEWGLTYQAPIGTSSIAASQTPEAEELGSSELEVAELAKFSLKVTKGGTGSGTVTSTPAGINCGALCEATLSEGLLRLTAASAAGSNPVAWTGCTAVNGSNECEVTLLAAKLVTATFALTPPAATCATDASLCPPVVETPVNTGGSSGGSSSGSGSGSTPITTPKPVTKPAKKKKPLQCKKGFKKKTLKGKQRCVKVVKKHH